MTHGHKEIKLKKHKKFPKIKYANIHMGMFDFTVKLIVCPSAKEAHRYVDWLYEIDFHYDEKLPEKEYDARGKCFFKEGFVPVVWMPKKPTCTRQLGTISHEMGHAVGHLFDWAGLKHNTHTEEVYQHAVTYLTTSAFDIFKIKVK